MLRLRIISACAMGALLLAVLLWLPRPAWTLFSVIIIAIAAWEWGGFARQSTGGRIAFAAVVIALTFALLSWSGVLVDQPLRDRLSPVFGFVSFFWIAAVPLWILHMPSPSPPLLVLLVGLIVLPPTALAIIDLRDAGVGILLAVMSIVWVSDVAAYFVGRAYGKRKLAPKVSPGKTVEGAIGALVGVACYTLLMTSVFQIVLAPVALVLAIAVFFAVLGIFGDLFESALKRQAELKDSGTILPGHGGVLDRIDALLPVLPMAALLLPR